jgi:hypothetical protein
MLPPAIVIHGLEHARLALAPARPVTLLSAPGAALYAGCLWWRSLLSAAQTDAPDILDCADAAGRALEALSIGCKILVLQPCRAWPSVADRAARHGATLLDRRPAALDLAQPGGLRHIARWLTVG